MILLELFIGFLKVGCFAFGGAYGAIPLIRDVVLSYGWLDDEMLTYMIAVSESTPGPIMVNLATYVGSSRAGFYGSLVATLAVVLPSFIIILLVTALLKAVLKNRYVQAVLRGLKPCIVGIILAGSNGNSLFRPLQLRRAHGLTLLWLFPFHHMVSLLLAAGLRNPGTLSRELTDGKHSYQKSQ